MARVEIVSSQQNPLVRDVRKAMLRGQLTDDGWCLAESFHLLEEALRSDCEVHAVLASESVQSMVEAHVRGLRQARVVVIADKLFDSLAGTEATQGVIALVRPKSWGVEHLFRGRSLVVVLDGLQDPGNAGAIVRTAEAFGATGAMFLQGSASPFNPKTLRASAGSLFRLPYVHNLDVALARASLQQRKVEIYAGVPYRESSQQKRLNEVDLTAKCALVVGSEGRGVSEELRSVAFDLTIPTVGVESLNAGVAAAVMLYEAHRQRMAKA